MFSLDKQGQRPFVSIAKSGLNAMLIHGMIIQGDSQGDHCGPVAIGATGARAAKQCVRLGQRIAGLVKRFELG